MRLAILGSRGIPGQYGGFETFAEELSRGLVKRGIDVTVYCEGEESGNGNSYQGVNLEYIPAPRLGPLTTIIFDIRCLWHARKSFDIVYMLGYGTSVFCFIPRIWGSKVWINMDGVEWARAKWSSLAKLWFRLMESTAMWTPDRLIADAEGILHHLQSRHAHLPPVSVIPYGAAVVDSAPDVRLLAEWRLTAGNYHLVVCRLEPENSVKEILKGFLLSGSPHSLVVVGSIDTATDYVKELLQLNNGKIIFIGPLYDKEKLQALRYHSKVYFHGHTVGGTNPSLLEALGCGNLIIAHDNLFNREVAGEIATYFRHAGDLAESIRAAESYPIERLQQTRSMAQERIRNHYSWHSIIDTYSDNLCLQISQPRVPHLKIITKAGAEQQASSSLT